MGLLHRRMGHSGNDAMQKLLKGDLVRVTSHVKIEELGGCDFCKLGKLTQKPHPAAVVDNKRCRSAGFSGGGLGRSQ